MSAESGVGGNYKLMGGLTLALAGVMAKLGLKSKGDDSSVTSGSSGIVSKRMSLLQRGEVVPPMNNAKEAPSFIEISKGHEYVQPEMVEADEGIEVEGPIRPSSQYAM